MPATTRLPRVRASELVGRGWLGTGGTPLTLADLRGRVTVLDFWTFCCINCLHVLDELRELEEERRDVLTIVGVHSPKFVHEADPDALAAAVERYEVRHPVLDDPDLVTWSAYGARAWPTLVVIDPEGYVVAQMAGEGHAPALAALVDELTEEHRAKGTLRPADDGGPYVPPQPRPGTLRFPAKAVALANGNLLVADAGHHSLAELAPDGETLVRRVGSGERGLVDGEPGVARFSEPGGLALVPEELRAWLGYDVVVADTVNHALRGVRLADGHVRTVAGTGEQYVVGAPDNLVFPDPPAPPAGPAPVERTAAHVQKLSSPWDVAWSQDLAAFVVAMAGTHTLWAFDGKEGSILPLAGTEHEGLRDGPFADAWFAQPSGLAVAPDGRIWVADSETSALRSLAVRDGSPDGEVSTAVGQGLFEFGHRDGPGESALLQHPLGVGVLPDGSVLVADTYNGALRRYDAAAGSVSTVATGLAEPSDVVVLPADAADDGAPTVLVVESAAHRLTRVALPPELRGELHDGAAHRTQRPVTELAAGPLRLEVPFVPAPGQKLDDRYGPATRLQVSTTPPDLLVSGAGDDVDLTRDLVLAPGEGVLHVTAQAASCDDVTGDPAIEFPACHLAQQDWGVPVRVVATAPDAGPGEEPLVLPLRG